MKPIIVCVDDEKVILDSLKTQLKSAFGASYSYEMAESAQDALDLVDELNDDGQWILVIVSDWLMPGMKGDELLIRLHDKFPTVIKIMLSGQADDAAINRAFTHANLYKCIKKPWTEEELVGGICEAIAQLDPVQLPANF